MIPTTRRNFLQTTAASTLLGTISPALDRREPPALGLSFSLYGMRMLPTPTALRACAEIGYDGVELVLTPGWPADPKKLSADDRKGLRQLLADHNLRVPAFMENMPGLIDDKAHSGNLNRIRAAGQLQRDISPNRPVILETILGGRPNHWDATKNKMVDRLGDWAGAAKDAGIVMAVKPHVGGSLHRPADAAWLCQQVNSPWIKLTYDYSHFQLRDFDMVESMEAVVPHALFIHVKDSAGDAKKVRFLLPGEGTIDYVAYLKNLQRIGYSGSICVEVSGQIHGKKGYDPIAAAKKSYAALAPAFEKAGIQRGK